MRTAVVARSAVAGIGVASLVLAGVTSAAPVAQAAPITTSTGLVLTQEVDPELGPVVLATYVWSGFHGRVTAHVTIEVNGVAVQPEVWGIGSGRTGDLPVGVPVTASPGGTLNTFTATGWLTVGRRSLPVAGSTTLSTPVSWPLVAVPCEPAA